MELIILLRASNSPLSIADIARKMYMSGDILEMFLDKYVKQGILQIAESNPNQYICLPQTVELREVIEETVRAYSDKRQAIISLIFSTPMEHFSDAFKLKVKED